MSTFDLQPPVTARLAYDGSAADELIEAPAGIPIRIRARAGADTVLGGDGADLLFGQNGNDLLAGGSGNDEVSGGAGNDGLQGGTGDDKLMGGTGADTLEGGTGNDTILGGPGADFLIFGPGTGHDLCRADSDDRILIDAGGASVRVEAVRADMTRFVFLDAFGNTTDSVLLRADTIGHFELQNAISIAVEAGTVLERSPGGSIGGGTISFGGGGGVTAPGPAPRASVALNGAGNLSLPGGELHLASLPLAAGGDIILG